MIKWKYANERASRVCAATFPLAPILANGNVVTNANFSKPAGYSDPNFFRVAWLPRHKFFFRVGWLLD